MAEGALAWLRIPDYAAWDWQTWALYVAAGTVGLLMRLSVTRAPVVLPRIRERGLYLNALGEWVTAVGVACLADHNLLFATCAAAGAPYIVQAVLTVIPAAIRRGLRSVLLGDDSMVSRFLGPDDRRGR